MFCKLLHSLHAVQKTVLTLTHHPTYDHMCETHISSCLSSISKVQEVSWAASKLCQDLQHVQISDRCYAVPSTPHPPHPPPTLPFNSFVLALNTAMDHNELCAIMPDRLTACLCRLTEDLVPFMDHDIHHPSAHKLATQHKRKSTQPQPTKKVGSPFLHTPAVVPEEQLGSPPLPLPPTLLPPLHKQNASIPRSSPCCCPLKEAASYTKSWSQVRAQQR